MKKLLLLLAFTLPVLADNCGTVVDQAGVFKDSAKIENAAKGLIDQGVDVRVLSLKSVPGPLINSVNDWRRSCGIGTKANLLIVAVAPFDRKKNVFYGETLAGAYNGSVDEIYSRNANPYFRSGQWGEGVAATLGGLNSRLSAYYDEKKHPIQATTIVNPTDLTPVKSTFLWLFFWIALFGGGIAFYYIWSKRREEREKARAAQAEAISAREEAGCLLKAKGLNVDPDIASRYQTLSSSLSYDPDEAGLTAEDYYRIKHEWGNLTALLQGRTLYSRNYDFAKPKKTSPRTNTVPAYPSTVSRTYVSSRYDPPIVVVNTPVVYEEPVYVHHTPRVVADDTPSYSPSSSGSDSSWSSSSNDNSRSSSGSDSSWSSSSDSGSSSSDFGGSSDSSW